MKCNVKQAVVLPVYTAFQNADLAVVGVAYATRSLVLPTT